MSRGILSDPVIMLRAETHFTYWPSHRRAPHLACRREDTGKVPWVGWPPSCPRSYGRSSGDGILSYRTHGQFLLTLRAQQESGPSPTGEGSTEFPWKPFLSLLTPSWETAPRACPESRSVSGLSHQRIHSHTYTPRSHI